MEPYSLAPQANALLQKSQESVLQVEMFKQMSILIKISHHAEIARAWLIAATLVAGVDATCTRFVDKVWVRRASGKVGVVVHVFESKAEVNCLSLLVTQKVKRWKTFSSRQRKLAMLQCSMIGICTNELWGMYQQNLSRMINSICQSHQNWRQSERFAQTHHRQWAKEGAQRS